MRKAIFSILAVIAVLFIVHAIGIRANFTPSMPIGLYDEKNKSPERGDIVCVCLPNNISNEGIKRHYLFYGNCDNGAMPVLKTLIAVPGDHVVLTPSWIIVNDHSYSAPQQERDSRGSPVKHFLAIGDHGIVMSYWLWGSGDKQNSWDSRYFGGVKKSCILGVYRALWVRDSIVETQSPLDSPPISTHKNFQTNAHQALTGKRSPILARAKIS